GPALIAAHAHHAVAPRQEPERDGTHRDLAPPAALRRELAVEDQLAGSVGLLAHQFPAACGHELSPGRLPRTLLRLPPAQVHAVDVQLDDAVVGDDLVVVPLAAALGPVLARQAPLPPQRVRPVRGAVGAPDAEQVAVAGGRHRPGLLVLVLQVDEHLHLDPAG